MLLCHYNVEVTCWLAAPVQQVLLMFCSPLTVCVCEMFIMPKNSLTEGNLDYYIVR